jgi:Predicted membrane protein
MLLETGIPFSYIIKKIKYEIIYIFLTGLAIVLITRQYSQLVPEIPYAIPTFLGTAISVILSFKLSQSYDRWWEARKIWGSIVNDSRNLVLQLQSFTLPGNEAAIKNIAHKQIAWCYCLGNSLRQSDPVCELEKYLTSDELTIVSQHSNKPLALLSLIAQDVSILHTNNQLDTFSHIKVNDTIVALTNSMGMAERIKSTVFPSTYRLFLHLIIYVFLISLSISLRGLKSYFEIPILLVIGSFFFLLESTARNLQDPFSNKPTDTAVTTIARNIEINIKQLIGDTNVPQPLPAEKYYII